MSTSTTSSPIPHSVGFWRSVNNSFNSFAVEDSSTSSQWPRSRIPTSTVAPPHQRAASPRRAGTRGIKGRVGDGAAGGSRRGIAVYKSFESFAAQVAEVSVSPAGDVRVHRVVCAIDCGMHVNPSTIEAQMQSGIVFGLTAALKGAITIENGRVTQSNFHDYQCSGSRRCLSWRCTSCRARMSPEVWVSPGPHPSLRGLYAIFAATGKRIRRLPIER